MGVPCEVAAAKPQGAVRGDGDGCHRVAPQPVGGRVGGPGLSVEAGGAAAECAEPHGAVGTDGDRVHGVPCQSVGPRVCRPGLTVETGHAAGPCRTTALRQGRRRRRSPSCPPRPSLVI